IRNVVATQLFRHNLPIAYGLEPEIEYGRNVLASNPMSIKTMSGRDLRQSCTASALFSDSPSAPYSEPRSKMALPPSRISL
ncbi:MAG: hypothetical protein KGM92_11085, partial [Acidobacteriota bacterium]|nr:hypothetical protein [Acidobacteriota bacterium]